MVRLATSKLQWIILKHLSLRRYIVTQTASVTSRSQLRSGSSLRYEQPRTWLKSMGGDHGGTGGRVPQEFWRGDANANCLPQILSYCKIPRTKRWGQKIFFASEASEIVLRTNTVRIVWCQFLVALQTGRANVYMWMLSKAHRLKQYLRLLLIYFWCASQVFYIVIYNKTIQNT